MALLSALEAFLPRVHYGLVALFLMCSAQAHFSSVCLLVIVVMRMVMLTSSDLFCLTEEGHLLKYCGEEAHRLHGSRDAAP